jgi:hypothetical protein
MLSSSVMDMRQSSSPKGFTCWMSPVAGNPGGAVVMHLAAIRSLFSDASAATGRRQNDGM